MLQAHERDYAALSKEHEIMKDALAKLEKETKHSEFFMNKVFPIKQFSMMCNFMHAVLGPGNKQELNNLIAYEHKRFEELLLDPLISNASNSVLKQFDVEAAIPKNLMTFPAIQEARASIRR